MPSDSLRVVIQPCMIVFDYFHRIIPSTVCLSSPPHVMSIGRLQSIFGNSSTSGVVPVKALPGKRGSGSLVV